MLAASSRRGVLFNERQQRPCGRWWTASRKLSPSFPGRHSRTPRNSWPCPPSLPTAAQPCNPPSIIAGVSTRARRSSHGHGRFAWHPFVVSTDTRLFIRPSLANCANSLTRPRRGRGRPAFEFDHHLTYLDGSCIPTASNISWKGEK